MLRSNRCLDYGTRNISSWLIAAACLSLVFSRPSILQAAIHCDVCLSVPLSIRFFVSPCFSLVQSSRVSSNVSSSSRGWSGLLDIIRPTATVGFSAVAFSIAQSESHYSDYAPLCSSLLWATSADPLHVCFLAG